jgi:hypothetical protein
MGTSKLYSWASFDRAHEQQGEADDAHDEALAAETKRHSAAIRTNCLIGHEQTLASIALGVACKIGDDDSMFQQLVRTALSCGPATAGQVLIDMINKEIDADAENEAIKELERGERAESFHARIERKVMDRLIGQLPELTVMA